MVTTKQLEFSKFQSKFGSRERLKCSQSSFQGIKTPIYYLGSQSRTGSAPSWGFSGVPGEEQSVLDSLLLAQWEERMWKGCLRYDVTTSEIKVVNGRNNFLAQLNEGRTKDQLPKSEDNKICHQSDQFVYHCMNHPEELLFCVARSKEANSELTPSAAVPNSAILIIINATPVEYGHIFLVPYAFDRDYQFVDAMSLEMILAVALEMNNYSFRLFYDCSGPDTSRTCFQACYFPNHLPVELMSFDTFFTDEQSGIQISSVTEYPIKTLLLECAYNFKIMADITSKICSYLLEQNISYNLLISDSGGKIYVFLQKSAASCNLSAWECSGYFLFKSKREFDQITEEALLRCLSAVSLDDESFEAVKEQLCYYAASKLAIRTIELDVVTNHSLCDSFGSL